MIAEDDPNIAKSLVYNLERESFQCTLTKSFSEAMDLTQFKMFDLYLLDVTLPDGNGMDICRHLRQTGNSYPVIFLTAKTDEDSVVQAFDAGASDFVRKPFSNRELIARIKANLPKIIQIKSKIVFCGLSLDPESRFCVYENQKFELNRRQFDILYYLLLNSERVVSRNALLDFLGHEVDISDRTIDAHVSQLRKKLKDENVHRINIQSVYGVGYRLEEVQS